MISIVADFDEGTVEGCLGCIGDIVPQRRHLASVYEDVLGIDLPDVPAPVEDYVIRFEPVAYNAGQQLREHGSNRDAPGAHDHGVERVLGRKLLERRQCKRQPAACRRIHGRGIHGGGRKRRRLLGDLHRGEPAASRSGEQPGAIRPSSGTGPCRAEGRNRGEWLTATRCITVRWSRQ